MGCLGFPSDTRRGIFKAARFVTDRSGIRGRGGHRLTGDALFPEIFRFLIRFDAVCFSPVSLPRDAEFLLLLYGSAVSFIPHIPSHIPHQAADGLSSILW
jgi:hypothetical protein